MITFRACNLSTLELWRLRPEDHDEDRLGYIVRSCLKNAMKIKKKEMSCELQKLP